MKVAIGSDHIAVNLKASLIEHLKERYEVVDAGTDSGQRVDCQGVAWKVTQLHASGHCERGILLCGTGVGMSLAANAVQGIRVVGHELAKMIADVWLEAPFEGGRHKARIDEIMERRKKG